MGLAEGAWCENVKEEINGLALCAGGGGLELGVKIALEDAYRTVCYVEHEAYAAAVLAARIKDKALDDAPIWDDLKTFDPGPWRGGVDIVTGGYPCQPFSSAGKRRGKEDPRHLWPWIADHLRCLRPELAFFENVGGHLSLGFREVHQNLRDMGYSVAAGLFSAEETGAPHRRERLFILAHGKSGGRRKLRESFGGNRQSGRSDKELADSCGDRKRYSGGAPESIGNRAKDGILGANSAELAIPVRRDDSKEHEGDAAEHEQREEDGRRTKQSAGSGATSAGDGKLADSRHPKYKGREKEEERLLRSPRGESSSQSRQLADADGGQREQHGGAEQGKRDEGGGLSRPHGGGALMVGSGHYGTFPPGPGEREAWGEILEQSPSLEPAVRNVADGMAPWMEQRTEQLRLLGNGVVPITAARAFVTLARALGLS